MITIDQTLRSRDSQPAKNARAGTPPPDPVSRLSLSGRLQLFLLALAAALLLTWSSPAAAQCSTPECTGNDGRGPEVSITPAYGDYTVNLNESQPVMLKIALSDADGLSQGTLKVRLSQGTSSHDVTGLTWTANSTGTFALVQGVLQLRSGGENLLTVEIQDKPGNTGSASATYILRFRDPNKAPVVSLAPHHEGYRLTSLGAATLTYMMPTYSSMGTTRTVGLYYNSQHANPTGFVQLDVDTGTIPEGSVAKAVTLQIVWPDFAKAPPGGSDADVPVIAITPEYVWVKEPQGIQRVGAQWSMAGKPTGAYTYFADVRSYREDKTLIGKTRVRFRVLVVNETDSRYGSGWSLAGVQRVHPVNDGKVDGLLVNEGNGVVRFFEKASCSAAQCQYRTPAGDFSQIVYNVWSDVYGQYVRTYSDGMKITFAGKADGSMTSISDRFGRKTTFEWRNTWEVQNPATVLSTVTDPAGKVTTFSYRNGIYLQEIADPAERTASFTHTNGDLTQITGPASLTVSYDSAHRVVSYTDAAGTWDLAYSDTRGTLRQITSPAVTADWQEQRLTTTYKSLHDVTVLTAADQTSVCCNWAAAVPYDKVFTSVSDPLGHSAQQILDRYGNVTRFIDPDGRTGVNAYNAAGLPESVSNGEQRIESSWNGRGQLVSRWLNGTLMYSASYNLESQLEYEWTPEDERWLSYGSAGELTKSWTGKKTDETKASSTYEYTTDYLLKAVNGPSGQRTVWAYDNTWKNVSATVVQREDGTMLTESYTYDGAGRVKTASDASGTTSTIAYDTLNRLLQVTDADGNVIVKNGYTGDALTSVTDQAGKKYGYAYNAVGWLISETFPEDSTSRTYRYNKDGQLTFVTDRRGRTVSATYDSLHRIASRTADGLATTFQYPDHVTVVMSNNESKETIRTHQWTGGPDLVKATFGGPESNWYYEIATVYDELTWSTKGIDVRQYKYGSLLRTDKIRHSVNGHPTDTTLGSTISIEDLSGGTITLGYDPSGRHVRTVFPNGITQTHTYQKEGGRTGTQYSSTALNKVLGAKYSYDNLYRLTERTNPAGDRRWRYTPDTKGQLLEYRRDRRDAVLGCPTCAPVWTSLASESYRYDAVGNRTDREAALVASSNRYQKFDGYTLTYDEEGNITRKSKAGFDQVLTWNSLGQLASVTTNGVTVTYGYSPSGRRIRRTEGSLTRYYVYHNEDLLLELDGDLNPLFGYTHMPGIDRPLSVKVGGDANATYYYALTEPGHVSALLDSTGSVAADWNYAPFGKVESSTGSVSQSLKFMAREQDGSTGLYYVRARWYDPELARFISADPIGLEGGINTYAYVGNAPMDARDPSGLQAPSCIGPDGKNKCLEPYTVTVCSKKYPFAPGCFYGVPAISVTRLNHGPGTRSNEDLPWWNQRERATDMTDMAGAGRAAAEAARRTPDGPARPDTNVIPCGPCPEPRRPDPDSIRAARRARDRAAWQEYQRCAAETNPSNWKHDVWHEVKHGLFLAGAGAAAGAAAGTIFPGIGNGLGAAGGAAPGALKVAEAVVGGAWEALVDRAGNRYKRCGGFFAPTF